MKKLVYVFILAFCSQLWAQNPVQLHAKLPNIVVTIKPIYGLVAALMNGISTPVLLSEGRGSTHTLSLVPSDIKLLKSADLVFWVGSSYEIEMAKPLVKTMNPDQILALDQVKGLTLYPQRTGGLFGGQGCQYCCSEGHAHDDDHTHDDHGHQHDVVYDDESENDDKHTPIDGHFWLDIDNAKLCARAIADILVSKWPAHKEVISANLDKLESDLNSLKSELKHDLESIKEKAALIDHDSLQYMEKQFGFSIKGVLSDADDSESSASHLNDIKNELEESTEEGLTNVFFYESSGNSAPPQQLQNLASAYSMRLAPLDYVGEYLPKGIDLYQACLRGVAGQIKAGFK